MEWKERRRHISQEISRPPSMLVTEGRRLTTGAAADFHVDARHQGPPLKLTTGPARARHQGHRLTPGSACCRRCSSPGPRRRLTIVLGPVEGPGPGRGAGAWSRSGA
jgi:hypothetical protein